MAEIEYKGVKFGLGPSKLMILIPLCGTLIGGLWGGFEVYQRYLQMEKKIQSYTAPNLTGINQSLAVLETDSEALKQVVREQVNALKEIVSQLQTDVYDIKLELKQDLTKMSDRIEVQLDKQADNLDQQEIRNRDNVKIVRDIISAFEIRIDAKVDRLDQKIDTLEADLDDKIRMALSNPLNN